jgi:hypothetical protein
MDRHRQLLFRAGGRQLVRSTRPGVEADRQQQDDTERDLLMKRVETQQQPRPRRGRVPPVSCSSVQME